MTKQPGTTPEELSLPGLFRMFPDDATAEQWFEKSMWGRVGTPDRCPMCGSTEKLRATPSRKPLPYWCGGCRRHFSVRTNTVMHRSHISLQKWVIAIYLSSVSVKGVSSVRLGKYLGITQSSAYFMAQRLREAWSEGAPDPWSGGMAGPVEVDETYMGGLEKNKHASKRLRLGRGGVGKTAIVGMKDRATNQVRAQVVTETDARTLQGFIFDNATLGATVYTDDARAYKGLGRGLFFRHESVRHTRGEYVRGNAHTNGIESFWA